MNRSQLRTRSTLEHLASEENLLLAATRARRHKTRRPDVEAWWLRREEHLARLTHQLRASNWQPAPYHTFWIRDPKRREIAAAPFEDRVVHHALCLAIQPLLERRFIARSFSCQVGKGTTPARDTCRRLTNRYRYVLKCDVSKFFHSIDHAILRTKLEGEISCPALLHLCDLILASFTTDPATVPPALFPGDALIEASQRPRGLPIGNLTSQLWGNGQRLDNHSLDLVELVAEARFRQGKARIDALTRLNLHLEKLRVLWRLVHAQHWMSDDQARFVQEKINETGRMAGAWIRATRGPEKPG